MSIKIKQVSCTTVIKKTKSSLLNNTEARYTIVQLLSYIYKAAHMHARMLIQCHIFLHDIKSLFFSMF